jgi:hypothetical protein
MIIIKPAIDVPYQDQVKWCREMFGPASKTMNWSTVIPQCAFAFKDEKLALLYLLKFGGDIANKIDYQNSLCLGHYVSPIQGLGHFGVKE